MKHIIIALLLAGLVGGVTTSHAADDFTERWVIVEPQRYERLYSEAENVIGFDEVEGYWGDKLGPYEGFVIAFINSNYDYCEYHYYYHAAVQDGHTQYFDSEQSCLRQLMSYDYKQE